MLPHNSHHGQVGGVCPVTTTVCPPGTAVMSAEVVTTSAVVSRSLWRGQIERAAFVLDEQ